MKKLILILILAAGIQQLMAQAPRQSLIETFTGTWCGYCPTAMGYIDQVAADYPGNIIAITNHGPSSAQDIMGIGYTQNLAYYYEVTGFPSVMVDRDNWSSMGVTTDTTPQLITNIIGHNYIADAASNDIYTSPVSIDIASSYNAGNGLAKATVTLNFVGAASGDMRIVCLLVEDKVVGNSSYTQNNYLGESCSSPWSGSEYYHYPCAMATTLTGTKPFYHKNVVRYNMSGGTDDIWGTTGVIPASVTAGQHFTTNYSYSIPSTWVAANMKVVAFVEYFGNVVAGVGGPVLNAQQVVLGQTIAAVPENPAAINTISLDAVYPNPFSDITHINVSVPATQFVTIKVYDLLGHEVATILNQNLAPGKHSFFWNGKNQQGAQLSSGLYLIRLQTERQSLAKSIVLSRD